MKKQIGDMNPDDLSNLIGDILFYVVVFMFFYWLFFTA